MQKRSQCFVPTLLIKDFKYGPSLSIFVLKKEWGATVKHQSNLTLTNTTTDEFGSGLDQEK